MFSKDNTTIKRPNIGSLDPWDIDDVNKKKHPLIKLQKFNIFPPH